MSFDICSQRLSVEDEFSVILVAKARVEPERARRVLSLHIKRRVFHAPRLERLETLLGTGIGRRGLFWMFVCYGFPVPCSVAPATILYQNHLLSLLFSIERADE